jgi:AcrR family transcriptional regulator
MPRSGLTSTAVTLAAAELVDERGVASLTPAAVAHRTGVTSPSLYKHVHGLAELRSRLAVLVVNEMTERLRTAGAGRSGEDALRAGMLAYRDYVVAHPHRYAALPQAVPDDPHLVAAAGRMLDAVSALLRGYGLRDSAAVHAARCFRAAAHGFASLQAVGGFGLPHDLDASYAQLVDALVLSMARATPGGYAPGTAPSTPEGSVSETSGEPDCEQM